MADNTRKTSNIIHTVDDLNTTVNEIKLDVSNNTQDIGNIKVYDADIKLSANQGLTVVQNGNTTANAQNPSEWKLKADTNYLNTTLNFAKPDQIPTVYVKDIQSGDITTLQVTDDGNGTYTLTAIGGGSGGGGGFENITLAEGKCIDITTEPYDDNGTEKTKITVGTDTDCLNTTLNFAKSTDIITPGDGNINLSASNGIKVTENGNTNANATANTEWKLEANSTEIINMTKGNLALNDLSDVDASVSSGSENKVLGYDRNNNKWIAVDNGNGSGGGTAGVQSLEGLEGNLTLVSDDNSVLIGDIEGSTSQIDLTVNSSALNIPTGNLPISSEDNKVTLSDDDGTFQIETGADEDSKTSRVYVEADGKFGVGKVPTTRFMVGDIDDSEFFFGTGFTYVRQDNDNQSGLFLINNNAEGNAKRGIWGLALEDGSKNDNSLYIYNSGVSGVGTDPRFEFTAGDSNHLILHKGQLQTDTITTKDATSGDPADGKKDGDKVIRLKGNQVQITDQDHNPGTGGYSLDIRDNRGMFRLRNDDVVNGINDTATIALDVNSNAYNSSIEFRTGNVMRAEIVKQSTAGNQYWAQYCVNGSASGLEFRTAFGTVTEKTFETKSDATIISTFNQNNDPDSDNFRGLENYVDRLTVTATDIKASDGYVPQTDNSLVTKGWVKDNGGGTGTLPISSVDGYTTLDALAVSEFSVRAKQTKLYNQTSDDVHLILHHNKSWVEGKGSCYLYAGDTSGGRVGVGTGCTIAVGKTVDNPAYIPPDDPANPRPPEYNDAIPETIVEPHDSFRVCPEHGNVALGDTLTGAATNGVFARWDGRSLRTNFVTYCDVGTIPEVPKAVNPDYIDDVDSRPDDYDPATPEYILDPNATAEELKQYVSIMYGHWSQIGSLNTVGEAGGAPLTTINFFAPPNAAAGVKTVSKGFLHQSENKVTSKSFGFESQQTLVQGVETYAFYASGSAPARFNGQIQTNEITTQAAAVGDVDIILNGKTASFQADSINKAVLGTYPYKRNNNDTDATASISSRNGTLQAYTSTVSNTDVVAIDIYEGLNNPGAGMSIQWNNAGGAFDCPASEIMSKRSSGSNFSLTFSAMLNNTPQEYLTLAGGFVKSVDIKAPKIFGDGGGSVSLDSSVTIDGGAVYLNVGSPAKNVTIGSNTSSVAGGDGIYFLSRTHDLAFSSNEIRFNSDWSGGASEPTWVMTEDSGFVGNNNFNYVKCGSISGTIDSDASVTLSGQATLTAGDGSEYVPTDDASLVTKKYMDDKIGGGGVDEDTVPGSGANYRWNEKLLSVPDTINGVIQNNRQVFRTLYAYDGIFTDGLHWTPDGYSWHTSDQSSYLGNLENSITDDLGRVCKGTGNEYVVSEYISNDMKSWRRLGGVDGIGIVYLNGEFYHSDCSYKLDRPTSSWVGTGYSSAVGGSLTSGPSRVVACMESGLYAVVLSAVDGTAHWIVALDGEPIPYRAIGNGITGGLSICFSERFQKWMIASDDTFWISDDANVAATNWTEMALPTAGNWDRMVDDGGTISIASTDDNANIVLYCQEPGGPAASADWQTTTLYNNRGYKGFCGTNGRTIGSMEDEANVTDPSTGDKRHDYYYAVSGDVRLETTTDTSQIQLVSPTRDLRDLNPPVGLQTQSDANQFMAAEIAKRAIVVTLTQAEYDALSPPDENTLYLIT